MKCLGPTLACQDQRHSLAVAFSRFLLTVNLVLSPASTIGCINIRESFMMQTQLQHHVLTTYDLHPYP